MAIRPGCGLTIKWDRHNGAKFARVFRSVQPRLAVDDLPPVGVEAGSGRYLARSRAHGIA